MLSYDEVGESAGHGVEVGSYLEDFFTGDSEWLGITLLLYLVKGRLRVLLNVQIR